jgi:hypothetical protein
VANKEQLDQYTQGFPQTPSRVEVKILENLFSEEEAEMFLELSLMLETSDAVAQLVRNVNRRHG